MATLSRYYQILGLSDHARRHEIKKAFRELARRWHPDCNPDDPAAPEHFRGILEAYEKLLEHLRKTEHRRRPDPAKHRHDGSRPTVVDEVLDGQDIFHDYFGITSSQRQTLGFHQNDLRFDLQVSGQAMADGAQEWIEYRRLVFCRECRGHGGVRYSTAVVCQSCHGLGEVEEQCSIQVQVPPGSQAGRRLRIPGGGDQPEPLDPAGDLVILLHLGR
jgi:molecular chaperone DnaJ